ncbi:related to C6 zink-finger protein PRO1A [Fusarium mangiferae]|uniref:Related to C6 zink-finger protein PRO1A n=1 Tax=Fusarium mangiferae TaxID=192010 RepID=A0A1L7UK30_FUSMA|nr:uncharacterized protein FMAN_14199 [Fusarium mangiferae]CVL08137.1 related to C6 zink-finger protein PRO1A [Fusarium mangiferae]
MTAPTAPAAPNFEDQIQLDEKDQGLLDHFIQTALPTIFRIIESDRHRSECTDLILAALRSNSTYLHCCLGVAARHLKSHTNSSALTEDIDHDIKRHLYATVLGFCNALKKDENHQQILEATLGHIFFQSVVSRHDDGFLDPSWDQHFQSVVSLVQKLDLHNLVSGPDRASTQTLFNISLCSWVDILGATMKGRAPEFCHTYRKKRDSLMNPSPGLREYLIVGVTCLEPSKNDGMDNLTLCQLVSALDEIFNPSHSPSPGLRELMGCDDGVMYLISEIACLESLKNDGMTNFTLGQHVSVLNKTFLTKMKEIGSKMPITADGSLSPKQLSDGITLAFCIAARIFLQVLLPGFNPRQVTCTDLVEELTAVLRHIPSGPNGFDRNVAWVYLIGGSVSVPSSTFRAFFEYRLAQLGDSARSGTMERLATVLHEVWIQNDNLSDVSTSGSTTSEAGQPYIHWRKVMELKGWNFLIF